MKASLLLPLTTLLLSLITTTTTADTTSGVWPQCFEANIAPRKLSSAIKGLNNLGFDLLRNLKENDNLVISPFTLWRVLALTSVGAERNTLKQIMSVLGLKNKEGVIYLTENLGEIIDDEKKKKKIHFNEATRIYMQKGFITQKCTKELVDLMSFVDFGNAVQASNAINTFVKASTRGLIPTLIEANMIDDLTRMILVNTLYFKGQWKVTLDKRRTGKRAFFPSPDTDPVMVDTMYVGSRVPFKIGHSKDLNANVFQLPYTGDVVFLTILLPSLAGHSGFNETLRSLSHDTFNAAIEELKRPNIGFYVPKFKIDSKFVEEMIEAMENLGVKEAFTSAADFSSFRKNLKIDSLVHKTVIEVNEEGTEAASASGVGMDVKSVARPVEPIKINRPFIFVLHTPDIVLFTGAYLKP